MKIKLTGKSAVLKKISNEQKQVVSLNLRQKTTAILEALQNVTPVDTGLAKDSWKMSKNDNGYKLVNDVPYIETLNKGSSKQAPAHFVEATALKYGTPKGSIIEPK